MAQHRTFAAAILFVLFCLSVSSYPTWAVELLPLATVPDEVILKFKAGITRNGKAALLAELDAAVIRRFTSLDAVQIRLRGGSVKSIVAHYGKHPLIEYLEPNYIIQLDGVPNDPDFDLQWGLQNTGQSGGMPGADIAGPVAWDLVTDAESIVVAVVDSGVDYAHPDLAANIYINTAEIPDNGLDDDSNGFVDDVRGWNFTTGSPEVMDLHGHGTAIAGIVGAAGNNGIGVAGVAWNVKIMPVKWCSFHSGSLGDAIAAIEYAVSMNVDIMNLSWGFDAYVPPQALVDICSLANECGILLVCAAGNYGHNLEVIPHFPGCLQLPLLVNVAASNQQDFRPNFSNYGRSRVDLTAPGCDIHSTLPRGEYGLFGEGGPYIAGTGTSFAAPFVAGALALMKARYPSLTPAQIKTRLLDSVDVIAALDGIVRTGGRLNLHKALQNQDNIPPGPVPDFQIQEIAQDWALLTWSAAGDDGNAGHAVDYIVRCSTSPIVDFDIDAPPLPGGQYLILPADTTYSRRIDGLQCGTRYYFAIKAVDDASNQSPARMVTAMTLDCPPQAQISATSLWASITGQGSVTRTFTLTNAGSGPLQFDLQTSGGDWLSVEPENGTIPAEGIQIVTVVYHAHNLDSGDHTAQITITCNDPDQPTLGVCVQLQVEIPPPLPSELNLCNVPNPFNPHTEFRFNLSRSSQVILQIYNLLGEVVRTIPGGMMSPGPRTLDWDGQDDRGLPVSSGAYIYRLTLDGVVAGTQRKLLLIR